MRISDWSSDVCSSDLPERPVARDDQISIPELRDRPNAVEHAFGWDEGADHQDNRATFGQTEARALGGAGTEACEIDAIGDQCAIPAHAIALEVIGGGADETMHGKDGIFGVVRKEVVWGRRGS